MHFQGVGKISWGRKCALSKQSAHMETTTQRSSKRYFHKKSYAIKYTRRKVYFSVY